MSIKGTRSGSSPFDRLRKKLDDSELRCRECGFIDEDGSWRVTTSGARIRYQHVCPSCDVVSIRELRLD
ncbi:HVO_0649 family zinc finger protein [Natrialbaceae archaeon A-gly3]